MNDPDSTKKSPAISNVKQLAALKSQDKEYERRIADCPGLRVRISPLGKITFLHRYKSPATGKVVKYTLGVFIRPKVGQPTAGMTLAMARQRWWTNHDLILQRVDPKQRMIEQAELGRVEAAKDQTRARASVAQLVKDYVASIAGSNKSWRETQRVLHKYLAESYGDVSAYDLNRKDIKAALGDLQSRGKYVQANRVLSTTRAMFNWALAADWPNDVDPLPFNPCAGLKATKEQTRERALNDTELRQILAKLPQLVDEQTSDFLLFCLATGCRIGEAATMHYHDLFGYADGFNEWRQPSSKNSYEHTVYLSGYAKAILARQPLRHGHVWPRPQSHAGHIVKTAVASTVDKIMPELGVEKFTPHDLRRTFTTWLGNQGIDERVHDRVLNHQTGGIRRVYNVASYNQPAKEAWHKWGLHLQALSSGNVIGIKEDRA